MKLLFIAFFVCFVTPASAEVMDKEPALLSITFMGITSSIFYFLAARFKPWLLILIVPVPTVYIGGVLAELSDPYVGEAIYEEAGAAYFIHVYLLTVLMILSIVVGLYLRKKSFL